MGIDFTFKALTTFKALAILLAVSALAVTPVFAEGPEGAEARAADMQAASGETGADPLPPGPEPPALLFPEDIDEIRGMDTVLFRWAAVPDATHYRFVLARDRLFEFVVHENINVPETTYFVENLNYGTYVFKVSAIGAGTADGQFSESAIFIIVPPPPHKFIKK